MNWIMVFIGGGIGSLCRYGIASIFPTTTYAISVATLLANIISSFLLGVFAILAAQYLDAHWRALLLVGFCGGLSTFSTFSLENVQHIQDGRWDLFILYTIASVSTCLLAVLGGMYVASQLWMR